METLRCALGPVSSTGQPEFAGFERIPFMYTQQLIFQNCRCKDGYPFLLDLTCCSIPGRVGTREIGSAHAARGTPWLGITVLVLVDIGYIGQCAQFAGLVRFATHWEAGHLVGNHSSTSSDGHSFKERCIKWRLISKGPNDFGDFNSWDVELWLFIILYFVPLCLLLQPVLSFVLSLPRFLGWSVCEAWTSINPGFCQTSQT